MSKPGPTRSYFLLFLLLLAGDLHAQIFDKVIQAAPEQRAGLAEVIYKSQLRNVDSAVAFRELNQLIAEAGKLKDHRLESWAYEFMADYFAIRGENQQSPLYYRKAIDQATRYGLMTEAGIHTFRLGRYYFTFKKYAPAYQHFLEALAVFKETGMEKVPDLTLYYLDVVRLFYELGDLENAENYLNEALLHIQDPEPKEIDINNTLGLIRRTRREYPAALYYFRKTLALAEKNKDTLWNFIAKGNIGSIYFLQGDYDKALPYLRIDYEQSVAHGDLINAGPAMLRIANISFAQNRIGDAFAEAGAVEDLLRKTNILSQWIDLYLLKSKLYEQTGQPARALEYRKKYDLAKEHLNEQNSILAVERVKLKWEMDKYNTNLNRMQIVARTELMKRNSLAAVALLLAVISALIYNRQKLKRKKEKELFERQEELLLSEKKRAEEELRNATQEMALYTDNLKQKTELAELFRKELELLRSKQEGQVYDEERAADFERLLNSTIMTDESWDEFKILFNKVYKDFFFRLKERFNKLSETDIRLATLIRLQLSNREMAGMLGVTVDGIKKAKQRLRKKLSPDDESTLDEIICST